MSWKAIPEFRLHDHQLVIVHLEMQYLHQRGQFSSRSKGSFPHFLSFSELPVKLHLPWWIVIIVSHDDLVFIWGKETPTLLVSWKQDKQGHNGEREAEVWKGNFNKVFLKGYFFSLKRENCVAWHFALIWYWEEYTFSMPLKKTK